MKKTLKQAVADFNRDPKANVEALREHVSNDPVLALLPSGKVDYDETVEARSYYEEYGLAAPGARRLSELLEIARPPREFDVLRGVALFKGKAPPRPGHDEPVVDWNPVASIWRETVAYAVEHGKLPPGSDSETVAARLSSSSAAPEVPWPRLRKEWEALVASAKPADAAKVARVRARMAGEVATGEVPFVGEEVPAAAAAADRGLSQRAREIYDAIGGALPVRSASSSVSVGGNVSGSTIVVGSGNRVSLPGTGSGSSVSVLVVADRADVEDADALIGHLSVLVHAGHVKVKSVFDAPFGSDISKFRAQVEREADVILVLQSANLRYEDQVRAQTLRGQGKCVISVILAPCLWQDGPLGSGSPLPPSGKPIRSWSSRDEAWVEVVRGVRSVVDSMRR